MNDKTESTAVIELLTKVKNDEISCEDAHIELIKLLKNDASTLNLEEGKLMVDFGFWYATNSMHDGSVPIGNYLQRLMTIKRLDVIPEEWNSYINKK